MTRRTFRDMLLTFTTTVVNELARYPHRFGRACIRCRQLVTAVTVVGNRLLRLPMTIETRRVVGRDRLERRGALPMTNCAVVEALWLRVRKAQHRNHILVFVVRKFDRELQPRHRVPKRQSRLITRRSLRVTHRTDRRFRAAEELRPVTTHARIVTRVIVNIRKVNLVTRTTRRPVLLRRMRKLRIVNLGHG